MPIAFFYTGANTSLGSQDDPKKSLGGYASISPIPNGRLNAIFYDLTVLGVKNGFLVETRAVIIKNTELDTITPTIQIVPVDDAGDYGVQIAVVALDSNNAMEQILSPFDLPLNSTFEDATTEALELPAMPAGSLLGIWLQRTINAPDANAADYCPLADNYTADPTRNFNIVLNY